MRRSRSIVLPGRPALAVLALLLMLPLFGCGSMWSRLRENERGFALENARTQSKRGKCAEALDDLDRAESVMAIDRFAIESLQIRIRCYEKLERSEEMSAHRRLLEDFYTEEPMAFPAHDGSSVFRAHEGAPIQFERPPSWLQIERPRYTPYAQRSKIVGRVVISFGLAPNGKTTKIRILEMPHPLLASWAIESVARAKPARAMKDKVPVLESDRSFVTTFNFEWRWADEPEVNTSSSAPLPR